MAELRCDFCGEPVEGDAIRRGSNVYCCEACAFEATRSTDCAGRTNSVMSKPEPTLGEEQGGHLEAEG